ncbi:hypothetical protein SAMN03159496_01862 [Rhizobium sp. NFR07]|uniref:hypothetical protein n=1 Tax=Rhizobium sp. NFR07 TaxID=1566262 RepID=UPI0008DF3BE6|nr:hypothetical protein [Rhizobium sp. NFR07]SFB10083.1 hypothetical protein SAMN03159496_01862 [Rhizobium sp. NFR07]
MSASIARYLKDFGAPPPPPVMDDELDMFAPDLSDVLALPAEEPVDIEAERADALARGKQEAADEWEQRWAADRAALVEAHETEMAALKERLEGELAATIAARVEAFATATAQEVAEQTARVLAPLVEDAVAAKATADLADLIKAAIIEGEVNAVTVRGPTPMFEALRTRLGDNATVIRHVESDDVDLTVELGDASLVTRMSAWSASLKKVLG